jgi:ribosome-binding protein aMBF1 (putative translation factor)
MRKKKQREFTPEEEKLEQFSQDQVEKFLQFVEQEMDNKNLSVPDLARIMEMPRASLYPWFNRKVIPSIKNCYRILAALGIANMPTFGVQVGGVATPADS